MNAAELCKFSRFVEYGSDKPCDAVAANPGESCSISVTVPDSGLAVVPTQQRLPMMRGPK